MSGAIPLLLLCLMAWTATTLPLCCSCLYFYCIFLFVWRFIISRLHYVAWNDACKGDFICWIRNKDGTSDIVTKLLCGCRGYKTPPSAKQEELYSSYSISARVGNRRSTHSHHWVTRTSFSLCAEISCMLHIVSAVLSQDQSIYSLRISTLIFFCCCGCSRIGCWRILFRRKTNAVTVDSKRQLNEVLYNFYH
jgi:hypothetical protein